MQRSGDETVVLKRTQQGNGTEFLLLLSPPLLALWAPVKSLDNWQKIDALVASQEMKFDQLDSRKKRFFDEGWKPRLDFTQELTLLV